MLPRVIPRSQWIVWWWEVSETNEDEVERKEGVFSSEEEMVSFLESRLETGRVYGLLGSIESIWYDIEGELTPIEETTANGFYPTKKRPRATSQPVSDEAQEEE